MLMKNMQLRGCLLVLVYLIHSYESFDSSIVQYTWLCRGELHICHLK